MHLLRHTRLQGKVQEQTMDTATGKLWLAGLLAVLVGLLARMLGFRAVVRDVRDQ